MKDFAQRREPATDRRRHRRGDPRPLPREVRGAIVSAFGPPPIDGLGTTGGFKLIVEDRGNLGLGDLQRVSDQIVARGNGTPGLQGLFNSSRANTPWLYLDIDRTKCMALGVQVSDVFNTLQIYLGSFYVNNFNEFGRTWQVNVQADQRFRNQVPEILQLQVRNNQGQMIRLGTLMDVRDISGPVMVMRYNMYSAAAVTGNTAPGISSGQAIGLMQEIADQELPQSMAYDWTELTYLQLQAGNVAIYVFALGVVFVFLVLAAQYESWSLPLAVILVVPMCLLCSVTGAVWTGMDVNIFTQIGFVVLVGLAGKNAILIVEFAKQQREQGTLAARGRADGQPAAVAADLDDLVGLHFRRHSAGPGRGAGAEMRRALGMAVFSGMLGVTFFGIFLTPVFFYVIQWFSATKIARRQRSGMRISRNTSWCKKRKKGKRGKKGKNSNVLIRNVRTPSFILPFFPLSLFSFLHWPPPLGTRRRNSHNNTMAKRSDYQDRVIRNYYQNRDEIMLQRLGELVTDLFLAEGKAKARLWKRVAEMLEKLKVPKDQIQHLVRSDNPTLVANVLKELLEESSRKEGRVARG